MIGNWNAGCAMDLAACKAAGPYAGNGSSPAFPAAAELWPTGRCLKLLRLSARQGPRPSRPAESGRAQGKARQKVEPLQPFFTALRYAF
jgi:hypothetical protein